MRLMSSLCILVVLAACSPALETMRLSPSPYPARPADAVISVGNVNTVSGGTVTGTTATIETDASVTATVIRFKDQTCRE